MTHMPGKTGIGQCEGVDPMGRGRAKAKQTKVARELKYRSVNTDFASLERELRGEQYSDRHEADESIEAIPDAYADLAAKYADGDDYGEGLRKTS